MISSHLLSLWAGSGRHLRQREIQLYLQLLTVSMLSSLNSVNLPYHTVTMSLVSREIFIVLMVKWTHTWWIKNLKLILFSKTDYCVFSVYNQYQCMKIILEHPLSLIFYAALTLLTVFLRSCCSKFRCCTKAIWRDTKSDSSTYSSYIQKPTAYNTDAIANHTLHSQSSTSTWQTNH